MSTTHFGFQTVPTEEKASRVRGVFDRVAQRYDLMNDLMSFGLHRLWKETLIDMLRPRRDMRVIDVAGGTGDIATRCLKRCAEMDVTVCDINRQMLQEGRNRAIDKNILDVGFTTSLPCGHALTEHTHSNPPPHAGEESPGIRWVCGNAEALPFPDLYADGCTIAFGIRNVTDIPKALREMHRILKPGGHFLCLEFSHIQTDIMASIYDAYSFHVIPQIGKMVVGDGSPYQYLVESIRHFPNQESFASMLREAGFGNVTYHNLSNGVVAIHSGWRI